MPEEGADEAEEASESLDMSPEEAAAEALGEEAPEPPAEGGGFGHVSEPTPWWKSTEPNPPIEEVEPVEQWQEHWKEYLVRGGQKAAGADDAWAALDLLRGVIGGTMELLEEYDL